MSHGQPTRPLTKDAKRVDVRDEAAGHDDDGLVVRLARGELQETNELLLMLIDRVEKLTHAVLGKRRG